MTNSFSTVLNCFSAGSKSSLNISSLFVQKSFQELSPDLKTTKNCCCFFLKKVTFVFFKDPSNRTQYSARFREYSVGRGMVRSIQHLRQIVRVFIKQYGYTHFLNFQ